MCFVVMLTENQPKTKESHLTKNDNHKLRIPSLMLTNFHGASQAFLNLMIYIKLVLLGCILQNAKKV